MRGVAMERCRDGLARALRLRWAGAQPVPPARLSASMASEKMALKSLRKVLMPLTPPNVVRLDPDTGLVCLFCQSSPLSPASRRAAVRWLWWTKMTL